MATLAQQPVAPAAGDERFFLRAAIIMAVTIVSGFSFQYLMGRSTFASPIRVHLHAFFFMGWVAIYLMQNIFVVTGRMQLHRRLGWIAAFWGTSENNRKARYYRLTPAGRKQLAHETSRWDRFVRAVNQVLRPAEE